MDIPLLQFIILPLKIIPRFVEIIKQNTSDLEQTDICRYLKIISNDRFIYQTIKNQGGGEDKHKLYVLMVNVGNNAIIMKNIISIII